MQRLTHLFAALDGTTRRTRKIEALTKYFEDSPPHDAAWTLYLLSGQRKTRAVSRRLLRRWAAEETGFPAWLIDETYRNVGDLSETLALLLPDQDESTTEGLAEVFENRILPLETATQEQQRAIIVAAWRDFSAQQRLVFHKLISGAFRVGVGRSTVLQALAAAKNVSQSLLEQRLMGKWSPEADSFASLLAPEGKEESQLAPFPYYLASPLDRSLESLGSIDEWQIEWKWDGIRAQLVHSSHGTCLWSRGEEIISRQFPEIIEAAAGLPDDCILDGEVLAWENNRPLRFHALQRRLNRTSVEPSLFVDVPIVFMVYDLLQDRGEDIRDRPLHERRTLLENLLRRNCMSEASSGSPNTDVVRLSRVLRPASWDEVERLRQQAQQQRTEGVMIKRRASRYESGRRVGDWWKFKREPYSLDAVLVAAQRGHGKRATLYTDYTFAIWKQDELVTIAKAYSGLTDAEILKVDEFVRRNTTATRGPVRIVKPELVFEIGFDDIRLSPRHKSGIALRFPRMLRQRGDKSAGEADSIETTRMLLARLESDQ